MIVLLVLLFIVLIFFGYLFFAPFYVEINTTIGLYRLRFHRLASASLKVIDSRLITEIKLAGWTKQLHSPSIQNISKEKKTEKKVKIEKPKISWQKIRKVIKSFRVNKCDISIDSGNMQLNGILYPLFFWISAWSKKNIRINFIDENKIVLEIENNLARLSWAYFSF